MSSFPLHNPWRLGLWSIAAALLLIPLLTGAPWTAIDYIVSGGLLLIVGLVLELAIHRSSNTAYRGGVAVACIGSLLMLWITLAVGIIGSEDEPVNALYLVVILIGVAGAALVRLQPRGLAWVSYGMSAALIGIAIAALAAGWGSDGPVWPWEILTLNGFFAALYAAAGLFFRRAARENAGDAHA